MKAIAALLVPMMLGLQATHRVDRKADVVWDRIQNYRSWALVTPQPLVMDPVIAASCVNLAFDDGAHSENGRLPSGPSGTTAFLVYANREAAPGMAATGRPHFPAGAMIVKEKFKAEDLKRLPAGRLPSPELLTVMIKQPKGTNPSAGDWRYFVLDGKPLRTESGSTQHCASCHASQRVDGYVFRRFDKPLLHSASSGSTR